MAEPSRGSKISRRGWLLAGLAVPLFRARATDSLILTFDGDRLHVSSLGLHFLQGKSLSRLKEGSPVEYAVQVTLFRDAFVNPLRRFDFKFAVSYDVLATRDQFAVSTAGPPPKRRTDLSQSATETWCFEQVSVTPSFPKDRPFWVQLDMRALPQTLGSVLGVDHGISVDLIDIFSGTRSSDEKQVYRAGPLRLADLATPRGRAG